MRRFTLPSTLSRPNRIAGVLAAGALTAMTIGTAAASTGSDISAWQHPQSAPINWAKVHAAGNDFVFIKASEGTGYTNSWYYSDATASRAAGLFHGAYDFARPGSSSGAAEARHFAAVIGSQTRAGDLPPVLDLEDSGGLSASHLIRWVGAWLRTTKARTHRTPMIYVSPSFWIGHLRNTHRFAGYPLWIADWGTSRPALVGGWHHWMFWQFTSSARVAGIRGRIDQDRYVGTDAQLRHLARVVSTSGGSGSGTTGGSGSAGTGTGNPPVGTPTTAQQPAHHKAVTRLHIKVPTTASGAHPVSIRGALRRYHGKPVASAHVDLQVKSSDGSWHNFDSLTTTSKGTYGKSYRVGWTVKVRAVFAGTAQLGRTVTYAKTITVHKHWAPSGSDSGTGLS